MRCKLGSSIYFHAVLTRPLTLAVALLALIGDSIAQRPWRLGSRAHYGFLWPHRPASWILVEGHATALEVFAERQVSGTQPWHHDYAFPIYGIGVLYTGLANPERIGGAVRVLPFLYVPFKRYDRVGLGVRLGWGVGYVAKPFDRTENTQQIAIGSQMNTAIQIMPELRCAVDRLNVQAGLGIDHWSNGSFRLPNLGLNYLSASLALSYALHAPETIPPSVVEERAPDVMQREWSVVGSFFKSETARPLSGQYTVYSLAGQRQWQVSRKSHVMAGVDVFNKGALATAHAELRDRERWEYTQIGVHGGYALGFGAAELFLHMGAYAYSPVPDEAPLFHRLGVRYRTGEHWVWNISLKSHYAVADHWEFGIGYRWS